MKKLLSLILVLVLCLSLAACGASAPAADSGDKHFTVTVVHGDGSEKVLTYTSGEDYLGAVLSAEGVIKGNAGPYGLEITEVDGEEAIYDRDKAYWAVYVGDEYALSGIDTTPITAAGDRAFWYAGGIDLRCQGCNERSAQH